VRDRRKPTVSSSIASERYQKELCAVGGPVVRDQKTINSERKVVGEV
jgi:hypothetical protein